MKQPRHATVYALRIVGLFNCFLGMADAELYFMFIGAFISWGSFYIESKLDKPNSPPSVTKEM